MMIISLIFAVAMIAGIYFYQTKNRSASGNRYNNKKRPENSPIHEDVLGLKMPERKSPSVDAQHHRSLGAQSDCVIALYLMSPEGAEYAGYELLQALLSAGMRYGKQRIFNRHEHKDGRGAILFHCASAAAPGTFDLTKMGAFSCKGLCLFFTANSVDDPLTTFDCLLETIDQLVEDIGGQVLDEKRALFTKDRMVQYRQQIRTAENAKITADMFA